MGPLRTEPAYARISSGAGGRGGSRCAPGLWRGWGISSPPPGRAQASCRWAWRGSWCRAGAVCLS